MEVTAAAVEWDLQEDREIWAQFLKTRTGQRLIPKIAEEVPALLSKGTDNEIFIRSGEVRGWQAAIRALLTLSVAEPPPADETPATYPNLTDDTAWNDGNKLTANPNPA